jgi:hypothetical protein
MKELSEICLLVDDFYNLDCHVVETNDGQDCDVGELYYKYSDDYCSDYYDDFCKSLQVTGDNSKLNVEK